MCSRDGLDDDARTGFDGLAGLDKRFRPMDRFVRVISVSALGFRTTENEGALLAAVYYYLTVVTV